MVVSGATFALIYSNSYLKYHLQYLLNFCENVLAYDLRDEQKGQLARLVRTKLAARPQLLVFGSSYSDLAMMRVGDYSV